MKSDVKVDGYERIPKNNYDAVMFALVNKGNLNYKYDLNFIKI